MCKQDLMDKGYGKYTAADIIKRAKSLMLTRGFPYYENNRLGVVPTEAVESILGVHFCEVVDHE